MIYIIVKCAYNKENKTIDYGDILHIESVWSTKDLARTAILVHAHSSRYPKYAYRIIEREVDKAFKNDMPQLQV